jgi:hypothetical protein
VLHLVWGEEVFSPVQYNTFHVGGHSLTLPLKEGESVADAYRRGWQMLEELAQMQFNDKLNGFAERLQATKKL